MKKVLLSVLYVFLLFAILLAGAYFGLRRLLSFEEKTEPQALSVSNLKNGENEGNLTVESLPKEYKIEGITPLAQMPDFPAGCESVSSVMALRHFGIDISVKEFIDSFLDKSYHFYSENGKNYGPDPKKTFVGDPEIDGSFGCFSPVIESALKKCVGDSATVLRCDGTDLQTLCETYIAKDKPVIVWATISMLPTYEDLSWYMEEDDSRFFWPANEHCFLLTGYSETHYIFNDPYKGREISFSKELAESRYEELGKMSVVLF